MRLLPLLALAACGSNSPSPGVPTNAAPPPTAARASTPYDAATLIVRGRLDAYGGEAFVVVERIYKGATSEAVHLVRTSPPPADTDVARGPARIYFLAPTSTPDTFAPIAADPKSLTLDPAREPDVIAALATIPATSPASTWAADLATFRSMEGAPWTPAQTSAIAAGGRLFANIAFAGMPRATIERSLGKPASITTSDREYWSYYRHTGEAGMIRVFGFEHDRVVTLDIFRTQ